MRRSPSVVGSSASVALRYRHPLVLRGGRAPSSLCGWRRESEARQAEGRGLARRNQRLARVEAVLFVAGEPLNSRKIADLASLADGTEARTLIRQLNQSYDAQASAFRVEEVAGGFQLLTRPKFGAWLRRLHQTPVETRMSAPALETLAVVAYRQPVVRAEIEAIRGVQCGELLRQLMERDMVRIVGRSDELGRPYLYGTTRRFLQVFGLRSLDDLPRAASLRRTTGASQPSHETKLAAKRDEELTPSIDLKEESHVNQVATQESARDDLWKLGLLAGPAASYAHARDEDEDDDIDDEEEDDLDEDDDEDFEDEDMDDEDLDDDEWEEVDDEDEDWDEDDDDWDEDEDDGDGDDDDDEDWEDE